MVLEVLQYRAEDFKSINGSLVGDGNGHREIEYKTKLYLRAGGQESRGTTGQVGAYAFGRVGMSIQGTWSYDQGGVMRSNDPSEFVNDHCSTMALAADGTFTDQTAIGTMTGGLYSEIRPNEWDVTKYKGGGINCEADVYLRKAISLSGSKRVDDHVLRLQYKSYGWLLTVNKGTATSTFSMAEVQHEKLWYTYKGRTHVVTENYDSDGNLSSTVNEPRWAYSQYLESELEQEVSWEGNPAKKVIRYYTPEQYLAYKDDGFWEVVVRAFDTTDPQIPPQRIHQYDFK